MWPTDVRASNSTSLKVEAIERRIIREYVQRRTMHGQSNWPHETGAKRAKQVSFRSSLDGAPRPIAGETDKSTHVSVMCKGSSDVHLLLQSHPKSTSKQMDRYDDS